MPRAQKGERFGGRARGTPNKATREKLEQLRLEEEAREKAKQTGSVVERRKLGKEVLEEFMFVFAAVATTYQNKVASALQNEIEPDASDLAGLKEWGKLTVDAATSLAEFQSPKIKAVIPMPALPPGDDAKVIDGKVTEIKDPVALARLYQRRLESVTG